MQAKKLLMISTDRLIFDEKSAVRARQIEYAKNWDEVHIVIFAKRNLNLSEMKNEEMKSDGIAISSNCWIYSTGSFLKTMYPLDASRIGSLIIKEKGITEITCQDPFLTAMTGTSLKKRFGLPLEIQVHTDIGSPYFSRSFSNKVRLMMAHNFLPKADKIRVVSEKIKRYIEAIFKKDSTRDIGLFKVNLPSIEVRPIPVEVDFIKNAPIIIDLHSKYPQFSEIALMASRLEKEKNIEMAIRAWVGVLGRFPKAGLIIVGQGSIKSKLKSLISKLDLEKHVFIESWADKETLASYYKTADLFLNTSFFEGYGMTLVEAKAAGCPIVSTDVGVAKEVGAVIADFDSSDLADKIISSFQAR